MSGTLSHNPSQIIRQLLIDQSLGTDGGNTWPVYATGEVNKPDDTITVYDTTGDRGGKLFPIKEVHERPGTQIRIRGADQTTTFAKARAIAIALDEIALQSVTVTDPLGYGTATVDYLIYNVIRTGNIIPVPNLDNNLSIFTINIVVNLKQS